MNKTPPTLSRTVFLKSLAAAGIAAVGGYALLQYAPWLDYEEKAGRVRRPLEKRSTLSAQMRELIRYATLAANGHNTQPWSFLIKQDAVEIHPDYTRRLPAVDPLNRELWISLGCALENLLIAARATGFAAEVIYPDAEDFIHVRFSADLPQRSSLFAAIPFRQNTRSEYDGRVIKKEDLQQIESLPTEPTVSFHFVLESARLKTVLDYVRQGNLSQYADKAFTRELSHWLRFNNKEAFASFDGLYSRCSGNPEVPRWLGQMFMEGTRPQQQADADVKKLCSSAGAVVVASQADDKTSWVRAGQVYQRLALTLTSLNIKSAFLNQPIEVTGLREEFQSAIGLNGALPQLLFRFGYADAMPRSLRRPVEECLKSP